jgi:hypothetical protein
MSKLQNLYIGASGEFAVKSEFLIRGWNVATPEVDIGTDVFVINDNTGRAFRIQVKSTNISRYKRAKGFSFSINISTLQMRDGNRPDLFFVFPLRDISAGTNGMWVHFMIFSLDNLYTLLSNIGYNLTIDKKLRLLFSHRNGKTTLKSTDTSQHLDKWDYWDKLRH